MASWFANLASQASQLADSIVATVNAAESEILAEQSRVKEQAKQNDTSRRQQGDELRLPWDTQDESLAILSQDLMEHILKLPLADKNFTVPPPDYLMELTDFSFKEFIPVVMKLLSIDHNLSRIHAKLSPKMDEEAFWRHYYYRCFYLRAKIGMEGAVTQESIRALQEDDIIFKPSESVEAAYQERKAAALAAKREQELASVRASSPSSSSGPSNGGQNTKGGDGAADDEAEDPAEASKRRERLRAEAALAAEVEAELSNDDLGNLSDLDDLNLDDDDDFEDLGHVDVGNGEQSGGGARSAPEAGGAKTGAGGAVSSSAEDDELEAQIARELGEDD
jgi:hypothetical protein